MRRLILDRARHPSIHLSMAHMSRGLGMWDGYISEFISKGSPRELPEKQRHKLASMLQLPEAVLRHAPLPAAAEQPVPGLTGMLGARDVPMFSDRDEINLAAPARFIERPIGMGVKPAFALWISVAVGRLRPGDLAYFHPGQPPRAGDTAAMIREARIATIGEVESTDAERIVLNVDGIRETFRRADSRAYKLSHVVLA